MKKRDPLSTSETMRAPASPRLEPSRPVRPRAGFTAGLVGGFLVPFNVPAVDTFIEKPFSVLALRALTTWQNTGGGAGKQRVARLLGASDHHARARLCDIPRVSQLLSFSVGGLA